MPTDARPSVISRTRCGRVRRHRASGCSPWNCGTTGGRSGTADWSRAVRAPPPSTGRNRPGRRSRSSCCLGLRVRDMRPRPRETVVEWSRREGLERLHATVWSWNSPSAASAGEAGVRGDRQDLARRSVRGHGRRDLGALNPLPHCAESSPHHAEVADAAELLLDPESPRRARSRASRRSVGRAGCPRRPRRSPGPPSRIASVARGRRRCRARPRRGRARTARGVAPARCQRGGQDAARPITSPSASRPTRYVPSCGPLGSRA